MPWRGNRQKEIAVHKTEVFASSNSDTQTSTSRIVDTDKLCTLHKKDHPLPKCRTFRLKSLEEREAFLRESYICYKCCASSKHMAKDCKVKIQCSECNSDKHCAARHPSPAPQQNDFEPAAEHGGELAAIDSDPTDPVAITSKCTQVCGENEAGRSCFKICLVKVYPAGCTSKAVWFHAIHNEQSNISLVRPEFFELFNDSAPSFPYSLRTCASVKETMGRRATGYVEEDLDGSVHIPLPSLIDCADIPNDRDEIPIPSAARHHSHLKFVAHLIPDLDSDAPGTGRSKSTQSPQADKWTSQRTLLTKIGTWVGQS